MGSPSSMESQHTLSDFEEAEGEASEKGSTASYCRKLLFFSPEVHHESRVYDPMTWDYSAIGRNKQYSYFTMPMVEEVLASHLSPVVAAKSEVRLCYAGRVRPGQHPCRSLCGSRSCWWVSA